jgi:hypothetical protein
LLQAFAKLVTAAPDGMSVVGSVLPSEQGARFQLLFLHCDNPRLGNELLSSPPNNKVFLVPLYGAISRVAVSDMAFALRQPGYEVDIVSTWSIPAEKASAMQWVKSLRDDLQTFARGVYVNQLGETSEELVRAAYGPNYARLAEIKKKYDPNNVLRINQNIKAA